MLLLNVACSLLNVACLRFAHAKWYVGLFSTHVLVRDLIFDLHILMESRHLCFFKAQFSSTWGLCHLNFAGMVDIISRDLIVLVFLCVDGLHPFKEPFHPNFYLDGLHPFKESYRLIFCLNDLHPFKESYRLNFYLNDLHPFKESYCLNFYLNNLHPSKESYCADFLLGRLTSI